MSDKVVDHISEAPFAGVNVAQLSDDDIRQLVIHHATIIRRPPGPPGEYSARARAVTNTWHSWPQELRDRFFSMVLESRDPFWARPADTNNQLTPLV